MKYLHRNILKKFSNLVSNEPLKKNDVNNYWNDFIKNTENENVKIISNLSKAELQYFEDCYQTIQNLSPDEKKYFLFKFYRQSSYIDESDLNNGFAGLKNNLNPFPINDVFGSSLKPNTNNQSKITEESSQKIEKKEEEPKFVKKNFDIELTSIDAAKKLGIIKEIKSIFNIGLKESKDMVEKCPSILQKQIAVEDAEQLKEKLELLGCTITLK